jgi:hypothetical protein
LTFEAGAKLTQIETKAFYHSAALHSISIPQSIRTLPKEWWLGASLRRVIFESGASLLTMIKGGEVDLNPSFRIEVYQWDGVMNFPGYSVSIIPGVDDFVLLVTTEGGS